MKQLVLAAEQILYKLETNVTIQAKFNGLLNLIDSSFVKGLIGNDQGAAHIKEILEELRTSRMLREIVSTVKNILDCYSTDRFVGIRSEEELRQKAFDLNKKRIFQAAVFFNETNINTGAVSYRLHMDVYNSQPTIENRNRFWFPGPAASMLVDLKYHRGFVQIKQALDLAIIKYHKNQLNELGLLPVSLLPFPNSHNNFHLNFTSDDNEDDDDDDDFFDDSEEDDINIRSDIAKNNSELNLGDEVPNVTKSRSKRQSFFDAFDTNDKRKFYIDEMQFFTKQFPYPSYTRDE